VLKMGVLAEDVKESDLLSEELKAVYTFDPAMLSAALILALLASMIVASVLAVYQAYQSTRKAVRAAAAEREASMYCNDSICYGISGSHSCLLLIFLLIILSEEGVPYL